MVTQTPSTKTREDRAFISDALRKNERLHSAVLLDTDRIERQPAHGAIMGSHARYLRIAENAQSKTKCRFHKNLLMDLEKQKGRRIL